MNIQQFNIHDEIKLLESFLKDNIRSRGNEFTIINGLRKENQVIINDKERFI